MTPTRPPAGSVDAPPAPAAELANGGEPQQSSSYDAQARRRGQRHGRERGCWIYLPVDELAKTGLGELDGPPYYRVWGASRGRVVVQLYREGP